MSSRIPAAVAFLVLVPLFVLAEAPDTSWVRAIGGADLVSFATDIYADANGYVYVSGQAQRPGGTDEDLVVAKLTQWGETVWVRYLSGTALDSRDDIAHALTVDLLGNVYVAGALDNEEPARRDMVVAKFGPNGDSLWTWVSRLDEDDVAYDIAFGNNQLYACGVITRDYDHAFTVVRLDVETGALVWMRDTVLDPMLARERPARRQRTARYPGWYDEWWDWYNCATALAISPNDGSIVATGYGEHEWREYQMWTMKYDTMGNRIWAQHHGRTIQDYDDVAFDVAVALNGDVYITGLGEADASGYDWLTIRLTSGGAFLNSATLNAAYNGDEWATALCLDDASPQNVYVTGFVDYGPAQGSERIVTMKYDNELTPRWGVAGAQYQSHGTSHPDIGLDVHYSQGHIYVTGLSGPAADELVLLCYTQANASPKYEKWAKTLALEGPPGSAIGNAVYALDTNRIHVAGQQGLAADQGLQQMMALRFSYHYRDVTPDSLLAPVGTVNVGTRVVPVVRVRNLGDGPSGFEVRLQIGDPPIYHDTTTVTGLLPGATAFAVFDTWTAGPTGTHDVLVTTALVGDENPANDTLRGTVAVAGKDVGVSEVVAPVGHVPVGTPVIPTAIVTNYGEEAVGFPVFFTIGSDYFDSTEITLAPGVSDTVRFGRWSTHSTGEFPVVCWTLLAGDMNPANDTLRDSVMTFRLVRDVGVTEIIAPVGTVDSGQAVIPLALVHNFGLVTAEFPVFLTIGPDYSDSVRIELDAGAGDTVRFRSWTPVELGWLETVCWSTLTGDMNPANDTLRDSVEVIPLVGVAEPAGLPAAFALEGVRPTPFRGVTAVRYALPQAADVELAVYNAAGVKVRSLVRGLVPAGRHAARWDGLDDAGRRLGPGVYLCRFAAGEFIELHKLVKLD